MLAKREVSQEFYTQWSQEVRASRLDIGNRNDRMDELIQQIEQELDVSFTLGNPFFDFLTHTTAASWMFWS